MNKICRICLEEGVLSSIFAKNYNLSLRDMIEYCSNIKIEENDGLPDQICSNCAYKLGIAYHFKQTCESSDIRIRQYLGLGPNTKFKDANIMTDPIAMTRTTIIKKWTHTGDKPFACMFCSRRFTQKHNLTIHLRMHTGEKPFQCEMCSKTFSTQGNLTAHIKTHTGQKDHVCEVCNKGFITSSELTRHMTKHTGFKNFKCDLCNKAYSQKRDFRLHKIRKHGWIPDDPEEKNDGFNTNINIVDVDEVKNMVSSKNPSHCANNIDLSNKNQEQYLFNHSVFGQSLSMAENL